MRYNGLHLVIRMAVHRLGDPLLLRFEDALVLGALREDVVWIGPLRKVWEHWSFTHFSAPRLRGGFIPLLTRSAAAQAQRCFDHAVRRAQAGQWAAAFVRLGRASHLLVDMACPVHAHGVAHWTDGLEWAVEAHADELAGLPFELPAGPAAAAEVVDALARFTRGFAPDRTHHAWGYVLRVMGLRRSLPASVCREQARQLVPAAAGHLAVLYRLFLQAVPAADESRTPAA